jgi:hypothetical protein
MNEFRLVAVVKYLTLGNTGSERHGGGEKSKERYNLERLHGDTTVGILSTKVMERAVCVSTESVQILRQQLKIVERSHVNFRVLKLN